MNHSTNHRGGGRGFTLVELLVVVSLIMLLLGIAAPSLAKYFVIAKVKMTEATINTLHTACYVYEADFASFPTSTHPSLTGAQSLCFLLTGYTDSTSTPKGVPSTTPWLQSSGGDGHDGPGYCVTYRGKVYGPYGSANALRKKGSPLSFYDEFNTEICYYRYDPTAPFGTMDVYKTSDNPSGPTNTEYFRDYERNPAQGSTILLYRRDFMLLSRGPDMTWCTGDGGRFHWSGGPDASGSTDYYYKLRDSDDINNLLIDGKGRDVADREWDRAISNQD